NPGRPLMTPRLACVLAVMFLAAGTAPAQSTFVPTTGTQTWNSAANWNPNGVPNGVGAATAFGPTGALTVNLDAGVTAGSVTVDTGSAGTFTLLNGTGGSLTFGNGGGEAAVVVNGTNSTTNSATFGTSATNLTVTLNS